MQIPVIPELSTSTKFSYTATPEEQARGVIRHRRLNQMFVAKSPHVPQIERGLMLYDGIHLPDVSRKGAIKNDNIVAPFARIFVEAKTAKEVKAFSEYVFTPVEDASDAWKVDLLKDVDAHVKTKVKQRSKRIEMIRMKNIAGTSIARIGYRKIMGMRKIRTETNDDGDALAWEEKEVPIYDDLIMDVVSPLDFLIDPNATTIDDAMDCAYFHAEHIDSFRESFSSPIFKHVEDVKGGQHGTYTLEGMEAGHIGNFAAQEDMVMICESFNKVKDEWIVEANGIEIYFGPLPDDHKELPFFSYHNNRSFSTGLLEASFKTSGGEDVGASATVTASQTFWTVGDPQIIMDLIELRTGHGRAAHRLAKRMSQRIIATRGNYKLPTDRNWLDGDEATGAAGNVEILNMAGGGIGSGDWQFVFDDLFQLMRLTIGVDPSNLADAKQKTATESEIQEETASERLNMGLEYNEENGETRMGMLIHKVIQQRYTKPELKRLLGTESEEEISSFDEIEYAGKDKNIPIFGKRYRRIKSSVKILETVSKDGKRTMEKSPSGVNSFLATPENIRTSDIDIKVQSGRKAAQSRSIQFQKYLQALQLYAQLIPLTVPNPLTGQAMAKMEDFVPLKSLMEGLSRSLDMDQSKAEEPDKTDDMVAGYKALEAQRLPITPQERPVPTDSEFAPTSSSS